MAFDGGGGAELVCVAQESIGGVVEANQEVARAVVVERRVQCKGHPAGTRGDERTLKYLVFVAYLHDVVGIFKSVFAHILHVHLDAAHGEGLIVSVFEADGGDGAPIGHVDFGSCVDLLGQRVAVIRVDWHCPVAAR